MSLQIRKISQVRQITNSEPFICPENKIQYCPDTNNSQYNVNKSIFEWDLYATNSQGKVRITNFFNIIPHSFYNLEQNDGVYTGSINILTEGKYQISLCNYFRADDNCNYICSNQIPNLYIYKSQSDTSMGKSLAGNPAPLCLDIGCNQECATTTDKLEVGDILHFILETPKSEKGTAYYRGFVNLILK